MTDEMRSCPQLLRSEQDAQRLGAPFVDGGRGGCVRIGSIGSVLHTGHDVHDLFARSASFSRILVAYRLRYDRESIATKS
jgi:hypothetical protein